MGSFRNLSGLILVISNLIPLIGVFAFGWDVGTILLLYWLESVIIGVLNVPKMMLTAIKPRAHKSKQDGLTLASVIGTVPRCIFFIVHFGMFSIVHLVFLRQFFPELPEVKTLDWQSPVALTALVLLVSHGVSFMINFLGKREYLTRDATSQMFAPYPRVMVMHVVIILGGFLVLSLGSPVYALVTLIAMKILIDLAAHNKEHRKAAKGN
ncbi:DUF6498-containing protein [Litorimonas sp. RW-G-Af-16]|uniref:DUF6498-containing protein n=1 Tax=Litorimonas sp. RW-G-Af-16 TaxID=3241168 RepID=UPI00390C6247